MQVSDFNAIEAIQKRRSVRTFDPSLPLSNQTCDAIADMLGRYDNPWGITTDSYRICLVNKANVPAGARLGTYGVISGASTFLTLDLDDRPQVILGASFEFERIILQLTAMGLGTVWLGATLSRDAFSSVISLPSDHTLAAISPVGYPKEPRFMERVMRKFVGAAKRKPWSDLFFDKTIDSPLTPEIAGRYAEPLEMVRLAPSATNTQPWRVIMDGDNAHFFADMGRNPSDNVRLFRNIDMGIAICHFCLTCAQIGVATTLMDAPTSIPAPERFTYIASFSCKNS